MSFELRLFPLNTVLFPGAPLPLHIFEERYKLLIRECAQENAPFGVVLIREGQEVGGPATPFDVGTTARIRGVQPLDGGRLNVLTTGEARFRILSVIRERPYLVAQVEWLPDEFGDTTETADLAKRVTDLFGAYYRLNLSLTGQWLSEVRLPADPARLANHVAARLEIPIHYKQGLLETVSVTERLRQEALMLEQETKRLAVEVATYFRTRYTSLSALN